LYDRDDNLLALIHENEWLAGDPLPWDLEASFRRLTLRHKRGVVALALDATAEPFA
jgi:hypothetical protein